ncbi:MAG: hypothetical protein C0597_14255 [Marinilabiliales bacterium]|nr:MAG: hypothetical protein C0597_14255 [Marinilabiliales bacterium]
MTILNITFNHKKLYYIGLILTAICLPLSKFALSVVMVSLICNWILELEFKRKWLEIKSNKSILIFAGVFAVHLIWLINTDNYPFAFHDLGNKAIILLYPIIIGTSKKLSLQQIKIILIWFTLAVVSSTIISTFILFQIIDYPIQNIRDISPFISHIRLSLLINVSIFSLGYLVVSNKIKNSSFEIIIYIVFIIWLIIFLYLLKSLTGIIVFIVLLFAVLAFSSFKIRDLIARLFLQVFLVALFLLMTTYITHSISRFYSREKIDFENLKEYTANGNIYKHYPERDQVENGNYVWINICETELEKEWNRASVISFKEKDIKGQEIRYTLLRYLTSKGYKKDSVGISKLTSQDIRNIENGLANYIYENKYDIYPRIYDIIWQIDVYRRGYNPAGNSITMRLELAKTGIDIIRENFWFGVGTGDVQDAFDKQYEMDESKLPFKYRLRAHNMYITFFLSFGFIGFILIFYFIFYPVLRLKGYRSYLFTVFFLIALLSFFNEDTLETQIGITFFSYFYSLFLFGNKINYQNAEDSE